MSPTLNLVTTLGKIEVDMSWKRISEFEVERLLDDDVEVGDIIKNNKDITIGVVKELTDKSIILELHYRVKSYDIGRKVLRSKEY